MIAQMKVGLNAVAIEEYVRNVKSLNSKSVVILDEPGFVISPPKDFTTLWAFAPVIDDRMDGTGKSQLMLAKSNEDVIRLNDMAHAALRKATRQALEQVLMSANASVLDKLNKRLQ